MNPDTKLGPYRIADQLGKGGMGEVYRATDTRLDRTVAIKVLPEHLASDPQRRERFEREAKAVSSLNHPHICTLYDVGVEDGTHYLVMELVEGETLESTLERGRLPLDKALEYAIQIADALDKAHRQGVVHRDLKPANIMLTKSGVKLLDFGLAKLKGDAGAVSPTSQMPTQDAGLTAEGTILGTLQYMGPEQLEGKDADARTDIFAFGAVVYEMVTGKKAFEGKSQASLIAAIIEREPQPMGEFQEMTPRSLDRLVRQCLAKDPDDRWQTAGDVKKRLTEIVEDDASARRPTATLASDRLTSGSLIRTGIILLVAMAVIAAVVGGILWNRTADGDAIDSVAVLPFINDSGSAEGDYLAEGLSDTIRNNLSQIQSLRVVPRALVAQYGDQAVEPNEAAEALNVRAVVTGRVVERGERLIVQAELIDAIAVSQIWGRQFDRSPSDLLSMLREISEDIVDNLRVQLTTEDEERIVGGETQSVEAYEAYTRGSHEWNRRSRDGLERATRYFEEASQIDPNYARAHAGLAHAYLMQAFYGYLPARDAYPKAITAATRAIEIDERSADALVALGWASVRYQWDWPEGQRAFRAALLADPDSALAYNWSSTATTTLGDFAESVDRLRRAELLDPLSPGFYIGMGYNMTYMGRYAEAIEALEKALELESAFGAAYRYLAGVHRVTGQFDLAVTESQRAVDLGDPIGQVDLAASLAAVGRTAEATGLLESVYEEARRIRDGAFYIAIVHAWLNQPDEAFAWLEEAYANRDPWLPYLNVHPELEALHDDPRFNDLVERIGIPPMVGSD